MLGLRAKNCRRGEILADERIQAAKKEVVLIALSQIASKFRARVGESLATVEKHSTPLPNATTPSIKALRAYSPGMKGLEGGPNYFLDAIPRLKRAIEIDPKFAMAYAPLGALHGFMTESALS